MSNIVGIDIGVGTIKVVSVSKNSSGNFVLDAIGEIKNPRPDWRNAIESEKNDKALQDVSNAIRNLLSDLRLKAKQAVVCLPEDEIISRLIRLPPLKESEIRDALKFEAETFIPYPLDQVSIDYEKISEDETEKLTVFVIAAKNSLIESYIKLFKFTGLELIALESPSVSIRRLFNFSMPSLGSVIIFDLGEKYSNILGINKGNISFTRSIPVGGESITRAISINLNLDIASAEEYKKAYGLKETELEGKIKSAIMPVFNNMVDEIRKAMALFMESQGKNPDLLILSGGGANMPGLAEELTKLLGIEIQIIQPFLKVDITKLVVPINLGFEGCRFALATGLSMRSLL
jgi:type IV pilus assembly protein PilM